MATDSATYTFVAFDLVTGRVLGDLPLTGCTPSWEVSQAGDLGGARVPLRGLTRTQLIDARASTIPWMCGIAVDRDGRIVWSGVITSRRYDSDSGSYNLQVPGLLAYWQVRLLTDNLSWSMPEEQFDIIRALMVFGDAPTIPIEFDALDSGVLRQRQVAGGNLTSVLDEVSQISDNLRGYEFVLESEYASEGPTPLIRHRLRMGSPSLVSGASTDLNPILLEYPGNVSRYSWDEDGDTFSTEIWGSSTTDEGVTLVRNQENGSLHAAGYPRVQRGSRFDNVSVASTLDGHIQRALAEASVYANVPTMTVRDEGDTAIGSWFIGDYARIRITDQLRFPTVRDVPGYDRMARIRAATLDPESRNVTLTVALPVPESV